MQSTRLISYLTPLFSKCSRTPLSSDSMKYYLSLSAPALSFVQPIENVPLKPSPYSMKLDRVLCNAKRILIQNNVGRSSNFNLQNLINEEIMVITQILQKLVGTSYSLSEMQKLFENESSSDHFIRGLVVLLVSKAACQGTKLSENEVSHTQWRLAKIVEMVHMAILIHKRIRNVAFNHLDSGSIETELNLTNKISVLYGDFLWAKAWKELADMGDIEVIDMMVSVLVNTSEGQFLTEVESLDLANKMNVDYWLEKNYLLTACLPAFGCKSTLKLAKIDDNLQKHAYEFGQSFGFFNKAYQEIKWFCEDTPTTDPIDLCSLPVIMHSMETGQSLNHLIRSNPFKNLKTELDPQYLFELVRKGPALMRSKSILNNFRYKSLKNLSHFPESEAKDQLKIILETMEV